MSRRRPKFKTKQQSGREPLKLYGGRKPLLEVLKNKASDVKAVYVASGLKNSSVMQEIMQLVKERSIPVHEVSMGTLDEQAIGFHHQGIAFQMQHIPSLEFEDLLSREGDISLLALDQVQDPMNVGAIIRSANAFGFDAVICPKDGSAPVSHVTVKSSAGAALLTPVVYVTNLARALNELKQANFWIVGLDIGDDAKPVGEVDCGKRFALVAGSEGKGLRPLVRKQLDFVATIPMTGAIESLNVSNACAIAMFALSRQ